MGPLNWKKKFLNMDAGVTKITVVSNKQQSHLPQNTFVPTPTPIENKLVRILDVKTLGSEVIDILRPELDSLEGLSPADYHAKLEELIQTLQELRKAEKRQALDLLYQDAIRVLQAETARNDLLDELRMMLLQG
ncbi:MAG: hypothetical protein LBB19_01135 [Puniceicoccales bacterium]|jgi:hypothetical protein|nr:hypothetical protein [Puniceicoccales bacterium]